jgi:hypothetical protein
MGTGSVAAAAKVQLKTVCDQSDAAQHANYLGGQPHAVCAASEHSKANSHENSDNNINLVKKKGRHGRTRCTRLPVAEQQWACAAGAHRVRATWRIAVINRKLLQTSSNSPNNQLCVRV